MIFPNNHQDVDETARVEALLKASADFQPEHEASYNFAAAALNKRYSCRRSSRPAFAMAASCLAAGFLVAFVFTRGGGGIEEGIPSSPFKPIYGYSVPPVNSVNGIKPPVPDTGSSDNGSSVKRTGGSPASSGTSGSKVQLVSNEEQPKQTRQRHGFVRSVPKPSAPTVQWQTERVERYASGMLAPAWREEKDENGVTVMRPTMIGIPLDSGETPLPQGAVSGPGSVSLVSYEETP